MGGLLLHILTNKPIDYLQGNHHEDVSGCIELFPTTGTILLKKSLV